MKLLGALGLDWKILIIQSINFLILFYILKGLFFRPFIQALKKEKEKIEKIQKAEEVVSKEKENWQKEKGEKLLEAKMKVEKILSEAEEVNRRSKEKAREEEIKQEREAIQRIRKQSKAILADYKNDLSNDYQKKAKNSLLEIFSQYFSQEAKIKIQDSFWFKFVKDLEKIEPSEIIQISREKIALDAAESLPPEVRKNIQLKKIPLEIFSAYPLSSHQKSVINKIFKEKIPAKNFNLTEKNDPNLIAGFRLEIGGLLVEQSLAEKIKKIFG